MMTFEETLAQAIAATGATVAFGMPGGGANLAMVGALGRHGITFVLAHAETPACIMASTYGHLTGSVSAAVVTRGPGAASAVNGAAQATFDRHPLILVTDSVQTAQRARIAHQRIDQRAMLAPVSKASLALTTETAQRAPGIAAAWPPGCVHLDQDPTAATTPAAVDGPAPAASSSDPAPVALAIAAADRPLLIIGAAAYQNPNRVRAAVETFGAPVLTTYQAVGAVPTESPINAGLFTNGAPEQTLMEKADLIVLIGLDMVEPIPKPWTAAAPVVSIAPAPTVEDYAPIVHEVVGDLGALAEACLAGASHRWPPTAGEDHRASTRNQLRPPTSTTFGPLELVDALGAWAVTVPTLTTTVDAGAHFLAIMPYWEVVDPARLLISNGLATMGYAVPAAIGAALARPDQPVLALTGDGGLGMTLAELETIVRLDLPITTVVFNDAALSLIQIKQGPEHGGDAAVRYRPTDFAAIAAASGMPGRIITSAKEVEKALTESTTGPQLIDARIDPGVYPHLIQVTRG